MDASGIVAVYRLCSKSTCKAKKFYKLWTFFFFKMIFWLFFRIIYKNRSFFFLLVKVTCAHGKKYLANREKNFLKVLTITFAF